MEAEVRLVSRLPCLNIIEEEHVHMLNTRCTRDERPKHKTVCTMETQLCYA